MTPSTGAEAARKKRDGAEAAGKKRDGPEGSSRRSGRHPTRRRVEGPQDGPARPGPRLQTMSDAGQAAVLLARLQTEESAKETQELSCSALLDSVMVAVIQMANYAIGLRDAVAHSGALTKAMARDDKYRKESEAHRQSLARLHEESKAWEGNLSGLLREAESRAGAESGRASAAEAKLELVSEKLRAAGAQIGELTRQLQRANEEVGTARDEARSAVERIAAAEKAAAEASTEKAGAVACADEASARAEEAEGRAWEAEAKAKEAEAKAVEAEAKAREAEARALKAEEEARRAEAAAGQAVDEYKASLEFKQEVIEGSLDAYVQGFQICKEKVSAALKINISELEGIRPGDPEEEPEEDEGKPGPSEP